MTVLVGLLRLLIVHDRVIRGLVAAALTELEAATAQAIRAAVPAGMLKRWASALDSIRPDGQHCQSWLWSAPAKHSTRQIAEVLERIAFLTELGVAQHLGDLNDILARRYARRMATRPPSISARIKEPARTVEMTCFLRYCLLTATDQLILMFQRRVADLWRHCADGVTATIDWAQQYQQLLQELADLAAQETVPDAELRSRLSDLDATKRARRAPSRASIIRQHLIDAIAPVRSLLVAVRGLAWQATGEHPVLGALDKLRAQYAASIKGLPAEVTATRLGPAWRAAIADPDRDRAMRALEVATLFALPRAQRSRGHPPAGRPAEVTRRADADRPLREGLARPAWRRKRRGLRAAAEGPRQAGLPFFLYSLASVSFCRLATSSSIDSRASAAARLTRWTSMASSKRPSSASACAHNDLALIVRS
jgi:hypothetical protein